MGIKTHLPENLPLVKQNGEVKIPKVLMAILAQDDMRDVESRGHRARGDRQSKQNLQSFIDPSNGSLSVG